MNEVVSTEMSYTTLH